MKSSCQKSEEPNDARNFEPNLGQVSDVPIVNQRIASSPSKTPDSEDSLQPDDIETDEPIESRNDIIIEKVVEEKSPLSMMSYNQWAMENQRRIREENPDCTVASFLRILWENWKKLMEEDPEKLILKTSDAPTPTTSISPGSPEPILIPERLPKLSSYLRAFECIENRGKISEGDFMTKWKPLPLSEKLKKCDQGLSKANKPALLDITKKPLQIATRPQKRSSFMTAFEFWCIEHRDKIREEDLKTEWKALSSKEKLKIYQKSHSVRKKLHYQNEIKPFLCYCAYLREIYKEKNKGIGDDELRKLMWKDWITLSEKVKQPYRDASNKLETAKSKETPKTSVVGPKRPSENSISAKKPKRVRKAMDEADKMKKAESSDVFCAYTMLQMNDLVKNGQPIDKSKILGSWMRISTNGKQKCHKTIWRIRKQYGMDKSIPISEVLSKTKHPLLTIPLFTDESSSDISKEDIERKWNALPDEERKQYGEKYKELKRRPSNPYKIRSTKHGRFEIFLEMEKEMFGDKFDELEARRSWIKMSEEEKSPYTRRARKHRNRMKQERAARNLSESKNRKLQISVEEEDNDDEEEEEEYEEMDDDCTIFDGEEEEVLQFQFEPSYEPEYDQEPVKETSSAAIEDPADIPLYF